jgi:hypothetical protein
MAAIIPLPDPFTCASGPPIPALTSEGMATDDVAPALCEGGLLGVSDGVWLGV